MADDTPREAILREEGDVMLAQLRKDQAELETVRAELEAAREREQETAPLRRIAHLEAELETARTTLRHIARRPCRIFAFDSEGDCNTPGFLDGEQSCDPCLARAALAAPEEG